MSSPHPCSAALRYRLLAHARHCVFYPSCLGRCAPPCPCPCRPPRAPVSSPNGACAGRPRERDGGAAGQGRRPLSSQHRPGTGTHPQPHRCGSTRFWRRLTRKSRATPALTPAAPSPRTAMARCGADARAGLQNGGKEEGELDGRFAAARAALCRQWRERAARHVRCRSGRPRRSPPQRAARTQANVELASKWAREIVATSRHINTLADELEAEFPGGPAPDAANQVRSNRAQAGEFGGGLRGCTSRSSPRATSAERKRPI